MKPEVQPGHRQDSQQHKDALGRTTPNPKGDLADSASLRKDFTGTPPDMKQRPIPNDRRNAPLHLAEALLQARCGSSPQGRAACP